jgi:hypothetical protein
MGGAMQLGCAEQRHVVGLAQVLHELRDELVRGEAAKPPVLGRDDDVEAPKRIGDLTPGLEPTQCRAHRWDRAPERSGGLLRGEVVPTACGEAHDVAGGSSHDRCFQKATPYVAFCKH